LPDGVSVRGHSIIAAAEDWDRKSNASFQRGLGGCQYLLPFYLCWRSHGLVEFVLGDAPQFFRLKECVRSFLDRDTSLD